MKAKNRIWLIPLIVIGLVLILTNSCKKADEEETGSLTDADGNVYTTITIDSIIWMVENLKTTKYDDGSSIQLVTDDDAWKALTTPAYCWYNNEITNKNTYGALYNWYAVDYNQNGNKNICPTGWYVPNTDEWNALENKYSIMAVGAILKESGTVHWRSPNEGATNESGFTGLPGGNRSGISGLFYGMSEQTYWWSSDGNYYYKDAWTFGLKYNNSYLDWESLGWDFGAYVRCVKKK